MYKIACFFFELEDMLKKWVIVLKKKNPLDILRFEILAFPLHVMIVLKAQFESDEFTFVRI